MHGTSRRIPPSGEHHTPSTSSNRPPTFSNPRTDDITSPSRSQIVVRRPSVRSVGRPSLSSEAMSVCVVSPTIHPSPDQTTKRRLPPKLHPESAIDTPTPDSAHWTPGPMHRSTFTRRKLRPTCRTQSVLYSHNTPPSRPPHDCNGTHHWQSPSLPQHSYSQGCRCTPSIHPKRAQYACAASSDREGGLVVRSFPCPKR